MQIHPARLLEARLARAMSQEEAAIAADLSARTIQRIEAGHVASLESTKALLTVFGAEIIHDPARQVEMPAVSPWLQIGAQLAGAGRRSASFCFDGLGLLLVVQFVIVAVAKFFAPDQTGLFVDGDGFAIGLFRHPPIGASELLGLWITPLMLLAALALTFTFSQVRGLVQPLR